MTKSKFQYVDDDILKDGHRRRVPTMMRDSKFKDGRSFWDDNRDSLLVVDSRRLGTDNKPGFRVFDDNRGASEKAAAYQDHERYLNDAWRGDGDAKRLKKTTRRDPYGREEGTEEEEFEDARAADAPPPGSYPYRASAEGTACSVDGFPGVLVREGNWLVCRPTKRATDARSLDRTCPACSGNGRCPVCNGTGDDDGGEASYESTPEQIVFNASTHTESGRSDGKTIDALRSLHRQETEKAYRAYQDAMVSGWRNP